MRRSAVRLHQAHLLHVGRHAQGRCNGRLCSQPFTVEPPVNCWLLELTGATYLCLSLLSEGDTHEHEVAPVPNPRVLTELQRADAVIYGMGSLYTSIFPSLILRVSGLSACCARAVLQARH